jgi:hypothetical protein
VQSLLMAVETASTCQTSDLPVDLVAKSPAELSCKPDGVGESTCLSES